MYKRQLLWLLIAVFSIYAIYSIICFNFNTPKYILKDLIIEIKPFLPFIVIFAITPSFTEKDKHILKLIACLLYTSDLAMIKRILSTFMSMLVMVCAFGQGIGSWKVYSNYSTNYLDKVIDSKNMVYYLSGGYVYAYDKGSGETIGYNSGNGLSDVNVIDIFRNYDRDYVMLFYQSGNIDLIYDDGNVVNMGDCLLYTSYRYPKLVNKC